MPFNFEIEKIKHNVIKMEIVNMQNDMDLKMQFLNRSLEEFYLSVLPKEKYPDTINFAKNIILIWKYIYMRKIFFKYELYQI